MKFGLRFVSALAALFLLAAPAGAADKLSADQVRELTLRAAKLLESQGVEAARQAFHAEGEYRSGEVYVNVIDENGSWVVYPPNPRNEGKSVLNVKDADGKLPVQAIIALAKDKGEGWVEYHWLNPASNQIEPKLTFVKAVPSLHLVTYAGVYK